MRSRGGELGQLLDNYTAQTSGDISKRSFFIPPGYEWFSISGQGLQMRKRSASPVHRADQNRNNSCLIGLLALQGAFHFDSVTIVGGKEIRTHQQQND